MIHGLLEEAPHALSSRLPYWDPRKVYFGERASVFVVHLVFLAVRASDALLLDG